MMKICNIQFRDQPTFYLNEITRSISFYGQLVICDPPSLQVKNSYKYLSLLGILPEILTVNQICNSHFQGDCSAIHNVIILLFSNYRFKNTF